MTREGEFKERRTRYPPFKSAPLCPVSRATRAGKGRRALDARSRGPFLPVSEGRTQVPFHRSNNGAVMRLPFFRDNRWGPFREKGCCSPPLHSDAPRGLIPLKRTIAFLFTIRPPLCLSLFLLSFSRRARRRLAAPPKSDRVKLSEIVLMRVSSIGPDEPTSNFFPPSRIFPFLRPGRKFHVGHVL